ncbi:LytR C-terminal domain-containing protein [Gordonia sp. PP30]|uniref:LytR C-terminal domain-containing protein n=1 Tax=unclassified Gordonia (in: high G+C Gram-positive bacteria) TaxID=2657482 RepID=UPI001FFFCD60|nr:MULTISPECIES: LytR C-terminal domain-containing protein [unclassified Gordonia (in: high G+C Gram-positive bacteria)]UQE73896.1 LytR C-terminal domain-containing protein [Gordonia sp. PP30]
MTYPQSPQPPGPGGAVPPGDGRHRAMLVVAGVVGAVVLALVIVLIVMAALGAGFFASTRDDSAEASGTAGAPVASAAPASTVSPVGGAPVCVFNAGTQPGLADSMRQVLTSAGYTVTETGNLATSSIAENTVFYVPESEPEGRALAGRVGAEAIERPSSFTRCPGQLVLVMVQS